jgi:hypothetical protein
MEEQQPKQEEQKSEPEVKESFGQRMKRGFGILIDKLKALRENMAEAQKKQEKEDTVNGNDMSYAPNEIK